MKETFGQFWRVVIVNGGSAAVDYGVLFLLSWATGVTSGNPIILLNVLSFTAGTLLSFHFNQIWSFGDQSRFDRHKKFIAFLFVCGFGTLVNTVIVRIITTDVTPLSSLSPTAWLLAAKLFASLFSFTLNFLGYKHVVFKK